MIFIRKIPLHWFIIGLGGNLPNSYQAYPLQEYLVAGEWIKVGFLYANQCEKSTNQLHLCLWNKDSKEQVFMDDLTMKVLEKW